MPKSRIFYVANMSFNDFRENIILAKISEFTVVISYLVLNNKGVRVALLV